MPPSSSLWYFRIDALTLSRESLVTYRSLRTEGSRKLVAFILGFKYIFAYVALLSRQLRSLVLN